MIPWDQQLARRLVRPLAETPITPNQITALSILMALGGAALLASGDRALLNWGAGVFALSRFVDHFDGELARLTERSSQFGYYFDYVAGGLSYGALFAGMGIGLAGAPLADGRLFSGQPVLCVPSRASPLI